MCISCGHPGLVHDGPDSAPFDSGTVGGGASLSNSGLSFAATPPAGSEAEITFLSGVTASNQAAATSFWTSSEKTALASGLALWSAEANITFAGAVNAATANFIFYRGHNGSAFESS